MKLKYIIKRSTLFSVFILSVITLMAQQKVTLRGVINNESGSLADITVQLLGVNKLYTQTDESGIFIIQAEPGQYQLVIEELGYVRFAKDLTIIVGKDQQLDPIMLASDKKSIDEVKVIRETEAKKAKVQPFNVNVVETKQFYNSTLDLNQLLTRTTGIRIREDGGLGSDFRFSLNGFSGKSVKFFLDGIPMDNFGSSLSLNNFPATMADRIEVYKGVVPMTLGADALGGAINVVTRSNPNYLDVSYSIGSFNTHKAGLNGAYTDEKTGLALRFNGFYNYSDNNYKVDVRPIRDNQYLAEQEVERFHDKYASVGGQFEVGVRDKSFADQLFVGVLASKNDKDVQTGVIMEQVYGAMTRNSSSIIPTLKYKKDNIVFEGLDFNFYGAYNMSKNGNVDTVALIYNWLQETTPNASEHAERQRTQLINDDHEALITSNLSYALTDQHELSLNYVLTDFERKKSDVEDPNNVTYKMPQRLQKHNIGLGLESHFGALRTNAFVKYYALYAESFKNVSQNTTAEYEATSTNKDNLGYGIAGTYFALSNLQIKASYEHSYRMPESTELLGDGLFVDANPEITPEKSDNLNLGVLYGFQLGQYHRFQTEANLIYRNTKDYIRQNQPRFQPTGRTYINVGDVETTGAEAEIRYNLKDMFFANVNASYQNIIDKTEFIHTGNLSSESDEKNLNYGYKLPNTPYLFSNMDLGFRLNNLGGQGHLLNVHYLLNFIEEYYLTPQQIGQNNPDLIPQQWAHGLMADYSLANGKYNIAFECANLTDNKLFDNYKMQKPGRAFSLKIRYFIHK